MRSSECSEWRGRAPRVACAGGARSAANPGQIRVRLVGRAVPTVPGLAPLGSLKRTPGPPSLSPDTKMMPLLSSTCWMCARVSTLAPAPFSNRLTVLGEIPASLASSRRPQPSAARKIDKSVLKFGEIKRHRSKEHLKYVARQPCLICGRAPSHAHHIRYAQPKGLGLKVSDQFTVPLCAISEHSPINLTRTSSRYHPYKSPRHRPCRLHRISHGACAA